MKKTLSILLILLLNPLVFVFAQSFSPRVMEVDLMKEELSLVRSKLIRIHPEPFHFLSFEDFEEKISNLKNRLEPMPVEQWYVHLASLISSLQDGHTVLLFNQEDRRRYFDQGGKILPFLVQVKDNKRAVLQHHFTNDSTLSASKNAHQDNSTNTVKSAQNRTRFGIADLWKIQRNQRSAMMQRRSIL